ncbi:MAG: ferritin family protein [Thermoanaerobacterium sp.]|nr:ferritin family protein [Thermoanaerobacterium sp.]
MENKDSLMKVLSDGINSETLAIEQYMADLDKIRNPYLRNIFKKVLSDEKAHQNSFKRAYDFFGKTRNNELTWQDNVSMRFKMLSNFMSTNTTKGFLLGVSAAFILASIGPNIKRALKPVAVGAVSGAMTVSEKMRNLADVAKQNIDVIAKDAVKYKDEQLSKMRNDSDEIAKSIIEELQNQRDAALKEAQDLKARMDALEKEISELSKNKE